MSQVIPFELESLAAAKRYQRWIYESVEPFLGQRILEIGSGIGNISQHLPTREKLILSEANPAIRVHLKEKLPNTERRFVSDLGFSDKPSQTFGGQGIDTVVSFNVMEHVEDDVALFADLVRLLCESSAKGPKRLVTLVPAHPFAYGELDKKFGHFRRYTRKSFKRAMELALENQNVEFNFRSYYMNAPALLGWWLNGKVLKKSEIGTANMELFEKLCPLIKPVDNFLQRKLKFPFGNSLIAVVELKKTTLH
jgi:SAM-dependent methyltransferase